MTAKLNEYNQKRNFARTLEPVWTTDVAQEGPRYVVQHHLARRDHYDFRLEWEGALLSWAVPKGPSYNTRDKRLAVRVEEHPLEYRNFEGTIPKGEYGGGIVMLWDEGYWEPYGDVEEGLSCRDVSCVRPRISSRISIMPFGSSPLAGSSKIRNSGFVISAIASASRCFMPRGKFFAFFLPVSAKCVDAVYSIYIDRIGKKPAPMLMDFTELKQDFIEGTYLFHSLLG